MNNIAGLQYAGNSVGYWHSKTRAFEKTIDDIWKTLAEYNIYPDGNSDITEKVRELANKKNNKIPPNPFEKKRNRKIV